MIAWRTLAVLALGFSAGVGVGAWAVQRATSNADAMPQAGQSDPDASAGDWALLAPSPTAPGAAAMNAPPGVAATAAAPAAKLAATPEPPASWMTIDQQRAAALAYRDHIWEMNRQSNERRYSLNAELFLIEGQDPGWAATMESRVRASMADDEVFEDAALESIECRVTVCRAVVKFADADNPQALRRNGGRSPWSSWRGAQITPVRSEINDGVPGFRATVYLGDDFENARLPRTPRAPAGPGGP